MSQGEDKKEEVYLVYSYKQVFKLDVTSDDPPTQTKMEANDAAYYRSTSFHPTMPLLLMHGPFGKIRIFNTHTQELLAELGRWFCCILSSVNGLTLSLFRRCEAYG